MENWQVALLVFSNLILWIPIIYTVWRGYFIDATILFLLFLASCLYHACGGGWWCASSLWEEKALDHVFVYLTAFWIAMGFWRISIQVHYALFLVVVFLTVLFLEEATTTFLFLIFLAWFLILFGIFRLVGAGEPLGHYDVLLILIAVLLLGGGFALHIIAGDVDSQNYWWQHSLWHILSMTGLFVVILIRDEVHIFRKWGITTKILWYIRSGGSGGGNENGKTTSRHAANAAVYGRERGVDMWKNGDGGRRTMYDNIV